ncbi:MAG: hypothetical protein ACTSPV_14220 [Candidatus Hodarchaeales archaeon]
MSLDDLSKFFKITNKIDQILIDYGFFKIETKDLILKANEGTIEYSPTVIPTKKPLYIKNLNFFDITLRRLTVISSPGFIEEKSSVNRTEKGFILIPKNFTKTALEFQIKFEIEYDIEYVVNDLVRRDHQVEAVSEDRDMYWLHAQLKQLDPIEKILRNASLIDIPFIVNVGIHQDIKTKFPKRRQEELELIAEWSRTVDRNKKAALNIQHMNFKRQKPGEKEITDVLRDLQSLFIPTRFKTFIMVGKDFYYSECFQGADFYDDIPFKTYPKWMSVISRTDLSLAKPVAKGELIYKKLDFQKAIEKALIKKRRKKKY